MKKISRTRLLSLMLALVMMLGLVACGGTQPEEEAPVEDEVVEEPAKERVLRMDGMANSGYPAPHTSSAKGAGYAMVQYIFDTLVWKNEDGFFNYLAESYSVSDDNLTYTFKLREGVKWNDGQPFTAEDVKFTFDYMAVHPYSWVNTGKVKEVRVVDELTVEIELKEIYVAFIADIAANLPIIPKHVYEKVEDPTTYTEPDAFVGTGPMMLESYSADTAIYTFVKNPNYFYGDVQIDRLILSQYDDPKTALLNGELDVSTTTSFKQAMSMQGEENITVLDGQSLWVCRLFINFDDPALATKEVRQAMAYATNKENIVALAQAGKGSAADSFFHPELFVNASAPDVVFNYDLDKAKALLAEAGYPNGEGIPTLKLETMETHQQFALAVQQDYAELGINVELVFTDANTFVGDLASGNYDLAINVAGLSNFVYPWGRIFESQYLGQTNFAQVNDPVIDELFAKIGVTMDDEEQKALIHELINYITENVTYLPLAYANNNVAYAKDLVLDVHPMSADPYYMHWA